MRKFLVFILTMFLIILEIIASCFKLMAAVFYAGFELGL